MNRRPSPLFMLLAIAIAMMAMIWTVTSISVVTEPTTVRAAAVIATPVATDVQEPELPPPDEASGGVPAEDAVPPEPTPEEQSVEEAAPPAQPPVVEPTFVNQTQAGDSSSLEAFTQSVMDGQTGALRGVFAPGLFAYPITEQPAYDVNWVSTNANEVTLFSAAEEYGVIALLAHNTLAGYVFDGLKAGDQVILVYGDGATVQYRITGSESYQALQPSSPTSNFVDLVSGETLSSGDVFDRVYTGAYPLVLQTCIEKDGNTKWGRLFLTASKG